MRKTIYLTIIIISLIVIIINNSNQLFSDVYNNLNYLYADLSIGAGAIVYFIINHKQIKKDLNL